MVTSTLDARGMRCPQPILKITSMVPALEPGSVLEITSDCLTFEDDIRTWCERMSRPLVALTRDGDVITAQIQF
jgi:tRNA 2-thiouridine synthesizing protein A